MRGVAQLGWVIIAFILALLALLVYRLFIGESGSLLKSSSINLESSINKVSSALSVCRIWRAPPTYFDPAAISSNLVEGVNAAIPNDKCSISNPGACEALCACLLKQEMYCNIGEPGYDVDLCINNPCIVQWVG